MIQTLLVAGLNPKMGTKSPLYTIAQSHRADSRDRKRKIEGELTRRRRLIESFNLFLEFGSDPFDTYDRSSESYVPTGDENALDHDDIPLLLSKAKSKSEKVTVLHELLSEGLLVHPILTRDDFDPNRRDEEGRTSLHAACRSHHGIGAAINIADTNVHDSKPPAPSFLDYMLSRGADPLAVDNNGRNLMHYMFIGLDERDFTRPDLSTLTRIATTYPSLVNQADKYGKTPFLLAIRNTVLSQDTTAALALLHAGADPHAVDSDHNSALHILSFGVCTPEKSTTIAMRSLFTTLLERGLNINARNLLGETPIFNVAKPIHQHRSRLYEQSYLRASDVVAFFESAGADLFATDKHGRGLLHHQARLNYHVNVSIFRALLSKGLDPALEDADRRTPLDVAAVYDSKSILELFSKDAKAEEGVLI